MNKFILVGLTLWLVGCATSESNPDGGAPGTDADSDSDTDQTPVSKAMTIAKRRAMQTVTMALLCSLTRAPKG